MPGTKRSRSDSLTGGTRDVSPQWLSFSGTQSAADTTTTATQTIPVQRLSTASKAQVMEVLKVFIEWPSFGAIASATEATDSHQLNLSTTSFGTTNTTLGEPRVFWGRARNLLGAFTAAGTYGAPFERNTLDDLTDGAGHGVLIATDNIYLQMISAGTGAANSYRVKILYRWKNIPLTEYVGIVQSQQ